MHFIVFSSSKEPFFTRFAAGSAGVALTLISTAAERAVHSSAAAVLKTNLFICYLKKLFFYDRARFIFCQHDFVVIFIVFDDFFGIAFDFFAVGIKEMQFGIFFAAEAVIPGTVVHAAPPA